MCDNLRERIERHPLSLMLLKIPVKVSKAMPKATAISSP